MSAVNTVVGALLPLIVTLALGFFAAWHHDFTPAQAPVLNRMVLLYALPLLLFTGTVTIKRSTLTSDLGLAAAIAGGMLGTFLVMFLIVRFALRRPVGVSALTALAVGAPAIPFAGVVVLGYLYGPSLSAVPVAVGALVFNVIEVPVTLVLLSAAAGPAAEMQAQAASGPTVGPSPAAPAAGRGSLAQHVRSTVKEPVVWAPVLALVLVVVGVHLPFALVNAMKLLGSATTGVALFASGIVLFSQRIAVSRFVAGAVAMRNVVAPAAVWVILAAIGMSHTDLRLAVLANALPAPVAAVIFAVQYRQGQREMASVVLFSSVGSLLTLAAFIALT
jgi:malonate transporter